MANICRLCLGTVPPSSIITVCKNHPLVEKQIKYLLPEIDMHLTPTFNLCNICGDLLQTAYNFVHTCHQTEETIRNYISQYSSTPANLDEIQKFQNGHFRVIDEDFSEDLIKIETHDVEIKSEIPTIEVMQQISATFVCDNCHKTFGDQETVERHQTGCFSFTCDQYEKVLHIKEEYDNHCESHSIVTTSPINIDLHEVERTEIGNSIMMYDVPEDVIAIPSQDLKIKTEFVNLDDINLSGKCHEYFEDETMERKGSSLISQNLEDIKVEPLPIEVNSETDINVREQVNGTCSRNEHHKIEKSAICDIPQSVCTSQMELQNHNLTHETSPEKYYNPTSPIQFKHEINRPYKCQFCDMKFKWKSILADHLKCRHEIDRPYKCPTCSMSFIRKSYLMEHIKCKHEIDRPYKCPTCNMSFTQKGHLGEHIKCKHGLDRPYRCQTCDMAFKRKSTLTRHLLCRHGIDRPYKCQICDMKFKRKSILADHIKCRHEIDRLYECQTCGMNFKLRSHLRDHIKRKHEIDQPYKCHACDMSFNLESILMNHIKYKHEIDRPYKCPTCSMSFTRKSNLTEHIKCKHRLDRPYKCQICDMSFKRKRHLMDHIKCKHELDRPHKCQICNMSFKRKGTLTRHMQSQHEIAGPYKCKICDKSFAVPVALKVHIETHTEPDENFSSVHTRGSNL